jgi:hypothetical protein
MRKLKSARHHWWPECVSRHWTDEEGKVHWILPSGEIRHLPPQQLGVINNGHMIKLSKVPGEESPWDENFEPQFNRADSAFPKLITWLEDTVRGKGSVTGNLRDRFIAQACTDVHLATLAECVVSLAVRSPMNRASVISSAEDFRGPVPKREGEALIGLNMRQTQRKASDSIGARAKFVIIHSPDRELVFGDGFFNNVRSPIEGLFLPRILAPITPHIAVLIVRPTAYTVEPKLTMFVAKAVEADTARASKAFSVDFEFH